MRKIVKPIHVFWTKPHSYPPLLLTRIQDEIFADKRLKEIAALVDLLNSETRLRILFVLSKKEWICVGDLADVSRLSVSAVSHQLGILRSSNWVKTFRRGKVVYYSLGEALPSFVKVLFKQSLG